MSNDRSAPPSRNLALDNTLVGAFELFRNKFLQNTDDMLPAQVIAYDRTTNRAQVQPLILVVNTLNQQFKRAQIASVPVLQIGGGGFVISFPIQTGDLGWIKANDRDISLFKRAYEQSPPNTQRKHNFSDALFIPDSFMKDVTIDSEDSENLVIQNLDGTVRVAIWDDKVKITAPEVIIDTPTTTCTGELIVNGDITSSTGNIVVSEGDITASLGDITASLGDITASAGDVMAQSISLHDHLHGGVTTGAGNTGMPI